MYIHTVYMSVCIYTYIYIYTHVYVYDICASSYAIRSTPQFSAQQQGISSDFVMTCLGANTPGTSPAQGLYKVHEICTFPSPGRARPEHNLHTIPQRSMDSYGVHALY